MFKSLCWFLVVIGCFGGDCAIFNATLEEDNGSKPGVLPMTFKAIYDSLENNEVRSYFLLYELARGFSVMESKFPLGFYPITRARCHVGLRIPDDLDIPPEYSEKFAAMNIPEEDSVALYRWVATSFKIHVEHRVKLRQNVVCFPNGACIDLDDVGSHCCPF
uniref:Putative secreted protein n=1 Tax=Xenopsylla cheopis TaxID=163159 RepID=A0A6M2DWN3_XENCH